MGHRFATEYDWGAEDESTIDIEILLDGLEQVSQITCISIDHLLAVFTTRDGKPRRVPEYNSVLAQLDAILEPGVLRTISDVHLSKDGHLTLPVEKKRQEAQVVYEKKGRSGRQIPAFRGRRQ